MKKPFTFLLLAASVAFSGCTHYTLKPERPETFPRSTDAPLPLTVGISLDSQGQNSIQGNAPSGAIAGQMNATAQTIGPSGAITEQMNATAQTIGPRFVEALKRANVFRQVLYPLPFNAEAQQGVDLVISGRVEYAFKQDPAQTPKIVFVIFTGFLTGALMTETSYHTASAELQVRDGAGAAVKSYSEEVSVEAKSMVSMFAEMSTGEKGPPAAVDNLVAKLVQAVIDDRRLFEKAARRAAAQPRATDESPEAPRGDAAKPWWK